MNSSKTWIETRRSIATPRRSTIAALIAAVWKALGAAHMRSLQRRHLFTLSEHQLRDIGLTRDDVVGEARKPFWR